MSDADARSSPRFDALWRTVVSDDANLQAAMRRVAETGCAVLADCDSASITIIERGRPVTVGSTNDTAQALDDAQYSAREGPCLTAAQEGRTIRIDDTGNDERWPRFVASASANGVRSSLSVPIDVSGPDTFAGFNVYGKSARRLQRCRRAALSGLRGTGVDRGGERPGLLCGVRALSEHGQGDGVARRDRTGQGCPHVDPPHRR